MLKKTVLIILVTLVVITLVISVGCTSQSKYDFSQVTRADVSAINGHWTSGAEDDGIIVHPSLLNVKGQTVIWSGVSLPVDIEIYAADNDFGKWVKGQLVYQGKGTISDWKGEIQVPFSSMNVPAGSGYGFTYVTIHMPDGKTYSANSFCKI